jgi:hypothetical protein
MADAEIQLLSGHPRLETLAICQHIALDANGESLSRADAVSGFVRIAAEVPTMLRNERAMNENGK